MKKLIHAPSVQVVRYKCCEQQHHRNEVLQKRKAPVIANEGFAFLVARGAVKQSWMPVLLIQSINATDSFEQCLFNTASVGFDPIP